MSQIARLAVPEETPSDTTDTPAIVLFGCEADGKPRGSWFAGVDVKAAKEAAALSGMRIAMVKPGELAELAGRVPKGRIFSSGKAFAPMIQKSVYEALLPHAAKQPDRNRLKLIAATVGNTPEAAGEVKKASASYVHVDKLPKDWGDFANGHTVLAYSPDDEAWFEAVIVQVLSKDRITLKWRDYSEQPAFDRQRHELGLLHPKQEATA
ncbi:MAG: hypothetical protein DCC69_10105 [Hyphomicrobiales bacterium]|nr:MAG: hypothetical protein DCC69_10105 [Hyphomicrobiales bacterium]